MNGEWIFQISLTLASVLVSVLVGYFLGMRSQRKQGLREYITGIVKDKYPLLFSEMKRNLEFLDNFLENPDTARVACVFPELDEIYNRGLEEFMKRHHKDLFLLIDSFQKKIRPKFEELDILVMKSMKKIQHILEVHLRKSLPKEAVDTSGIIARDLIGTTNIATYALPDLLNERDEEIRNKIEKCFWNRTSHIYREKAKRPFVIEGERQEISFEEISQTLIEKAKPHIASLKKMFKELKMQNDKEVKAKLLPLLQKYISNPI